MWVFVKYKETKLRKNRKRIHYLGKLALTFSELSYIWPKYLIFDIVSGNPEDPW